MSPPFSFSRNRLLAFLALTMVLSAALGRFRCSCESGLSLGAILGRLRLENYLTVYQENRNGVGNALGKLFRHAPGLVLGMQLDGHALADELQMHPDVCLEGPPEINWHMHFATNPTMYLTQLLERYCFCVRLKGPCQD